RRPAIHVFVGRHNEDVDADLRRHDGGRPRPRVSPPGRWYNTRSQKSRRTAANTIPIMVGRDPLLSAHHRLGVDGRVRPDHDGYTMDVYAMTICGAVRPDRWSRLAPGIIAGQRPSV